MLSREKKSMVQEKLPFNQASNRFFKLYWFKLLKQVANMAELRENDVVLDFGAGEQHLRRFLPNNIKYISCDVDQAFEADIRHLSELKKRVDVVFASNVFEHLGEEQLHKTLKQLLSLKPRFVVVAIPRETSWLNRFLRLLFRFTFEHGWEHKLGWKQITRILSEYFEPCAVKNFYFLQWIVLLKPKKSG